MSDGLNVGTVKGTVELEDRMSSAIDLLEHKIESLDAKFGGFGAHVAEQATSFFTAEAALHAVEAAAHIAAETLQEITIEGSHAADIEQTFEHLTQSAGLLGDTLLEKTREGLHGTVTDLDIMTRVNQNLSVGLNLTAEQMNTLANGAFALAKATGGSTAEAMDKLSDAMVTGRTRSIALLTGKIDLTAAEDKYAAKLGVTTDHLSEQGKQAAIQEAILEKVGSATERIGDVQVRLADKIQQVKVEFANFEEEVGTAIATSPVVAAGFDGIRSAIEGAFGDNQAESVKKIAHIVDDVAISVMGFAETVVDAVGVVGVEWNAGIVVLENVKAGWAAIFYVVEEGVALILEGVDKITFGTLHMGDAINDLKARAEGWYDTMATSAASIEAHKKAEDDWAVTTGKVKDTIEGVRQKMIEAQKVEGEFTDVVRDSAKAHDEAGASAEKHSTSEKKVGDTIAMTKDEIKKYSEAWTNLNSLGATWEDTLQTIDPQMVKTIQYYLDAGASVDNLAAAFPNLTKAQIESVKALEAQGKAEAAAADALSKLYIDYYSKKSALYGTDTQKAIAAADKDYEIRVDELQKKGVKDVEYYDELWDLRNKDVKLADDQRLLQDDKSKASLDKKLDDARDYYQFMLDHLDQYTQADRDAQRVVIQGLQDQRSHWGEVGSAIDGVTAATKRQQDAVDGIDAHLQKVIDDALDWQQIMERNSQPITSDRYTMDQFTKVASELGTSASSIAGMLHGNTGLNGSLESIEAAGLAAVKAANTLISSHGQYGSKDAIKTWMAMGGQLPQSLQEAMKYVSFREGGVGDFGDGTLAILHGHEAIVPLDKGVGGVGGLGNMNLIFNVNGTAVQAAQQIKDIIMRELQTRRQF